MPAVLKAGCCYSYQYSIQMLPVTGHTACPLSLVKSAAPPSKTLDARCALYIPATVLYCSRWYDTARPATCSSTSCAVCT
jgi:hypothetical protein